MKDLLTINLLLFVLVVITFHPAAFAAFALASIALTAVGIYNLCNLASHK